jgi:hypothetical protein
MRRWLKFSVSIAVILTMARAGQSPVPADAMGTRPSANKQTSSVPSSAPPVVDWTGEISLPDDILFTPQSPSVVKGNGDLIFVVSLDSVGAVTDVRPISGFSLYLGPIAEQIRKFGFSPTLADKTFVLRVPDPMEKFLSDSKDLNSAVCTSTTDLRTLYELGAYLWRETDQPAEEHCYKYILDRNPMSVAARYGVAKVCIAQKDPCSDWYLRSLIASNPEFIEAREKTVQNPFRPPDDPKYVADVDEILKLDIPLADRVDLLDSEIFWLGRTDKIDDAIGVIKKWNTAASELMAIYPPAMSRYCDQAIEDGLWEEAKGSSDDAIASYRIASLIAASDRMITGLVHLKIDLGLARSLRKSGHPEEAADLCDKWKTRWRKLVTRPVHHPWELREDGVGELDGRWEFSCGNPDTGFQLIGGARKDYPDSYAPYTALAEYYYSIGEVEKARDAEATASRLVQAFEDRID